MEAKKKKKKKGFQGTRQCSGQLHHNRFPNLFIYYKEPLLDNINLSKVGDRFFIKVDKRYHNYNVTHSNENFKASSMLMLLQHPYQN